MAKSPSNQSFNLSEKKEQIEISLKQLEKNFRKETSHPSRASWHKIKPLNTSDDPYISTTGSKQVMRSRMPHKEL